MSNLSDRARAREEISPLDTNKSLFLLDCVMGRGGSPVLVAPPTIPSNTRRDVCVFASRINYSEKKEKREDDDDEQEDWRTDEMKTRVLEMDWDKEEEKTGRTCVSTYVSQLVQYFWEQRINL
ncbi:hypothetical protein L5515_004338 [Caenorhabditis briggsae]|uniref:Uncharacterized protein n=1 Tax=Caenorhabditis briggsae TaxID=6238 RepID=A0AAE9EMB4_CAEBR|nr:hypothetical protein L5515_004338 [Caenorhabditis briggsae]